MQPAARLAAAIELLADVEDKMASRGAPADVLVSNFFRTRRYAGSKDKRAISGYVYSILRRRSRYLWAIKTARMEGTARNMMLAHLVVEGDDSSLHYFGVENPFAPTALTMEEQEMVDRLRRLDWDDAPQAARFNLPDWALPGLAQRFGKQLEAAAQALNQQAPMDIRLNALKTHGKKLNDILNKEYQVFEKTEFSRFGYRAVQSLNLGGMKVYKDGLLEVQDEAAQVASALVAAEAGMQVVDLCAGAGGKTLAVAADMANKGQIHAFDISASRLSSLRKRVQRAGARNVQVHRIADSGAGREIAFGPLKGQMDRVIVDAPCTGTGTWRRSPDQRWRFDRESLAAQNTVQLGLLGEAATMVKVGGRLVYMTCSLMPEENEAVLQKFVTDAGAQAWSYVDYRSIWTGALISAVPETLSSQPQCLQLAPHAHGTDGFFLGVLERRA